MLLKKVNNHFNIFIEFICTYCCFRNPHDNSHIVTDINEKNLLDKYNLSYSKFLSDFDVLFKNMQNLKNRIEEEIKEIDNTHKKMNDEIHLCFEEEHMKLNEKEKELKLELDEKIKVTKNKFEKYLFKSNKILNSCERIEKANNIYNAKINDNHNDYNINEIEVLYYISDIHQNNEKSKEFLKKIRKHLDISLNKAEKILNYKYYYFSGLPIPKNINVCKNQNTPSIYWDVGDLTIKKFEKNNNIKY